MEEYRTYKQLGRVDGSCSTRSAPPIIRKPKMELVYDDTELLHDRTTVDLFLAFSKLLTKKKEEFRQNHTTIVKDEYKIEDLMDQLRHRFHDRLTSSLTGLVSRSSGSPRGHYPISCNP